ncbi:hypothetical protein BDY19DRAFT_995033 [Irpex rosettiformis]|uniref:Uncharacterized protein n=1 Tax=Irpex rosettiformis TaxID=378272 RepID=A0ACB8TZ96_9APHY|nr:hypothetical protein BDY19DRAFT_995033 [Irpex rosettiformis]
MSSFWTTILDWFLPTIRLSDDVYDIEASRLTSTRIAHSHQRTLGPGPSSGSDAPAFHKDRDYKSSSGRVSRRESGSEGHGNKSKSSYDDYEVRYRRAREDNSKLYDENARLREQIAQLQKQLEVVQANECTRLTVTTSVSQPSVSSPPVSPTSNTSSEYYKDKYYKLRKEHESTSRTINDYAAELSSLRSFLSKTDTFDNATIRQTVQDLNGEIQQFAATVAETYHSELHIRPGARRKQTTDQVVAPEDLDTVERAVGGRMVELLMNRVHVGDPILLQYALQAWEVWCAHVILGAFCFGASEELDYRMKAIFKQMHVQEPVATTARWIALTHSYLKNQPSQPIGVLPTPVTPTSEHPPNDPRESHLQLHVDRNLAGVHALLTLAGYPPSHLSELTSLKYKLRMLCEEALKIATSLREAFMSQFLEVTIVAPGGGQVELTNKRLDKSGLRIEVQNDASRFDPVTMENVLQSIMPKHTDTYDRVLCTLELGLVTTSVDEQGRRMKERSGEQDSRGPESLAISRTSSLGDPTQRELLRQVMLKPRVLLESFIKLIDHVQ